jgi:hypothetical protein
MLETFPIIFFGAPIILAVIKREVRKKFLTLARLSAI